MGSKYQEAKDYLKDFADVRDMYNGYLPTYHYISEYKNSVDTLQELIDDNNKMQNEFDMLLDTNIQFEKENIKLEKELKDLKENYMSYQDMNSELQLYKRALDILIEFAEHKRRWYQVEGYSLKDTILYEAKLELESEKQ